MMKKFVTTTVIAASLAMSSGVFAQEGSSFPVTQCKGSETRVGAVGPTYVDQFIGFGLWGFLTAYHPLVGLTIGIYEAYQTCK